MGPSHENIGGRPPGPQDRRPWGGANVVRKRLGRERFNVSQNTEVISVTGFTGISIRLRSNQEKLLFKSIGVARGTEECSCNTGLE